MPNFLNILTEYDRRESGFSLGSVESKEFLLRLRVAVGRTGAIEFASAEGGVLVASLRGVTVARLNPYAQHSPTEQI